MDFRNYFEIPDSILYFNTPGNGLMPASHYVWRQDREKLFFDPKGDLRDQQTSFIREVKEKFATFFGCNIERTFLVPNFSFGFNTLLEGLAKNLKFALLQDDYPSLNYPIISRGFEYGLIPVSTDVENEIYQYIKKNKPDVLVLSIVNYVSGLMIDLSFVKQLKIDYPELLILADATQFLGTAPFDFDSSGFDAVGGSGYKWLMSGFGNGYMMVSEMLKAKLYTTALERQRPPEMMWAHKSILDIYFEPGHQDTISHGTLGQSVLFLEKIGLGNIKRYLDDLLSYAYRIFEEKGWLLPLIAERTLRSTVINLQINPQYYPQLLAHGVKCFPRGSGIRIGIHIYTTKVDIDRLVEIVESIENEFKNR